MTTTVVIPCYNERERIVATDLARLCNTRGLSVVFVDDGSDDGTPELLAAIVAQSQGQACVLRLRSNAGKGEAVRRGLLEAIRHGGGVVGFADADLATPVTEIHRLAAVAEGVGVDVVLGARVRLAGRTVERQTHRHYLGRVVATYIGLRTRIPVYDTQCGAKFFRTSTELLAALQRPFETRWLFDVELLRRLQGEHGKTGRALRMREEPLETWTDVGGSRLRGELLRVAKDFARLEYQLRRARSDPRREQNVHSASAEIGEPTRRATA